MRDPNQQDYRTPDLQQHLPPEFLPVPADGNGLNEPALSSDQIRQPAELAAEHPHIPEDIRPLVARHIIRVSDEFDRIDSQAQTTNGRGTRQRAGQKEPEDEERQAARAAKKIIASSSMKPAKNRQGLSPRGRLNADAPPPHVTDARRTY